MRKRMRTCTRTRKCYSVFLHQSLFLPKRQDGGIPELRHPESAVLLIVLADEARVFEPLQVLVQCHPELLRLPHDSIGHVLRVHGVFRGVVRLFVPGAADATQLLPLHDFADHGE